jgi:hypothetical protein
LITDVLEREYPIFRGSGLPMFDFEAGSKYANELDNFAPSRPGLNGVPAYF